MAPDVPLVFPRSTRRRLRNRPRGIVANANCTVMAMIWRSRRCTGVRAARARWRPTRRPRRRPVRIDTRTTSSARWPATGSSAPGPGNVRQAVATTSARSGPARGSTWCPGPARSPRSAGGPRSSSCATSPQDPRDGRPLKVSATCVRVPVVTGHSTLCTRSSAPRWNAEGARQVLRNAPGVTWSTIPRPASSRCRSTRSAPIRPGSAASGGRWTTAGPRSLRHRRQHAQGRRAHTVQIAELLATEVGR